MSTAPITQADRIAELYQTIYGVPLSEEVRAQAEKDEARENSPAVTPPMLGLTVPDSEGTPHFHEAGLVALIVDEGPRIRYAEFACSSDSQAHAFMGALADKRTDAKWKIKWDPMRKAGDRPGEWISVEPPEDARLADTRIEVPHCGKRKRYLHHVAIMDRSTNLVIATQGREIWDKLRIRMSCPTLDAWGRKLMPRIAKSGMLAKTKMFGLPESLHAYVLGPDAEDLFDRIVSEWVREIGGFGEAPVPQSIKTEAA